MKPVLQAKSNTRRVFDFLRGTQGRFYTTSELAVHLDIPRETVYSSLVYLGNLDLPCLIARKTDPAEFMKFNGRQWARLMTLGQINAAHSLSDWMRETVKDVYTPTQFTQRLLDQIQPFRISAALDNLAVVLQILQRLINQPGLFFHLANRGVYYQVQPGAQVIDLRKHFRKETSPDTGMDMLIYDEPEGS